jgi:hypothetical protein
VNPELGNSLSNAKGNHMLDGTSDNQVEKQSAEQKGLIEQQLGSTSINISISNKSDKNLNVPSSKTIDVDTQLHNTSYLSEALKTTENIEAIELNAGKATGNKIVDESNQVHSTSILDKLFGSTLISSDGGSSSFTEVITISNRIFLIFFILPFSWFTVMSIQCLKSFTANYRYIFYLSLQKRKKKKIFFYVVLPQYSFCRCHDIWHECN